MANAAKFYCQLSVLDTQELAGDFQAWSVRAGIPLTNLLRDALRRGWPAVRKELADEHGELTAVEREDGIMRALPPARREERVKASLAQGRARRAARTVARAE